VATIVLLLIVLLLLNLLLHDHVQVDDRVGHVKSPQIHDVDVAVLGADQEVLAAGFDAAGRDLLQPGQRKRGGTKQRDREREKAAIH